MLEKGVGGRDMMFLSGRGPEKLFWCGGDLFSRGLMNTFPTGCQTGPGSSPAVFHFGAIYTWSNLCRLDHATKTFLQAQNTALFGSGLGLGRNFFSCQMPDIRPDNSACLTRYCRIFPDNPAISCGCRILRQSLL